MSLNYVVTAGEVSSGLSIGDYYDSILVSGGTTNETLVTGGTMTVTDPDSLAEKNTVSGSCDMYVNNGGRIVDTDLTGRGSYGSSYLWLNFGTATLTRVNSGGYFTMQDGIASDTVVQSGGHFDIYGGTVYNTIVNETGFLSNDSGTIKGATVTSGGDIYVMQGAVASDVTIADNGHLFVSYGGEVSGTVVDQQGQLSISGAYAENTVVNSGGFFYQTEGLADGVTVNYGGFFSAGYPGSGGAEPGIGATNVKENGGAVYIGSGSSGTSRYDAEGGRWVYTYTYFPFPVEFASNTFSGLVYSDYRWGTVRSGTTAVDIKAVAGGLTVYSGGVVSGYVNTPDTWTSNWVSWQYTSHIDEETGSMVYDSHQVSSSAEVTTVGGLTVSSGGIVTGLIAAAMDDAGHYDSPYMTFAIAPDTVIQGTVDGSAFETNDGILSNASVNNVSLIYMDGASVFDVTQTNGSATVQGGAFASSLNFSGTNVEFSSGARVDGVRTFAVPYSYYEYNMDGTETLVESTAGAELRVSAGATVTNLEMDSQSHLYMEVQEGTFLSGTSAGVELVQDNGYFGDTTINNTYIQVKSSYATTDEAMNTTYIRGGTVNNVIVNNGAVVYAEDYATVLNMTENGGAVYVGDVTENPTVIFSFNSNTITGQRLQGEVTVHQNTIAQDNMLAGGELTVFSGGIVNDLYVLSKDMGMNNAAFQSGAIVSNFDITRYAEMPYHPGSVAIEGGARMDKVRLTDYYGISMYVAVDTVITNGSVDNIPFSVSGGVLSGFVANGEGWYSDSFMIGTGAQIIDSYIDSWGEIHLEMGSYARNLTIARNYLYVNPNSLAENITVGLPKSVIEEDGSTYEEVKNATVYVNKGGVIRDFTINELSTVEIYGGGKATGVMRIGDGQLTVYGSGTVDFDVTDPSAQSVARLDDFCALFYSSPCEYPFTGGVNYTITIDSQNQAAGRYVLAHNAYIGTNYMYFSVLDKTTGEDYGVISGWFTEVWQPDESYEIELMSQFAGNVPSGAIYELTAERVGGDDDNPEFDLVLTVTSEIKAEDWIAAPTVTANEIRFTNSDVVLTISGEGTTKEYSLNCEDWTACGDTFTATENGVYYFRDSDGDTHSEATMYRVSNIDKVAPTVPGFPMVFVDEQTASFSWGEPTDEFSGVNGFTLTVWDDEDHSFIYQTPGNGYELADFYSGTWHWTVQASDYAGNLSATVYGDDFTIEGGDVPRLDIPNFLVGNFLSDATNSQMGTVEHGNNGNAITIYSNGAPWGNGLFLDPGWDLAGVGDFDADGQDDFLRINGDGYVVGELTQDNGAFVPQVLNFKNAGWEVLGTGDFSGNGTDDVLIANPTGASDTVGLLGYWESGVTWTLINGYSAEWECIATGDFNADGKCDMLWRNSFVGDDQQTYNAFCTWIVEDPIDWRMVSVANPAEWNFLCAGDFNGDGMNDIAMINDVGVVGIWGVEDGWLSSWSILSAVNTDEWKLVGVGDFNADGTDDIAWCSNISGLAGYWQINDKTLTTWSNLANLA